MIMEINKVQWRLIAKGAKLPCDSFLMRKDGTITSMATSAGVTVGQDAYYLPVDELRTLPKEESEGERMIQYFKDLAPFDKADELYEKYGFSHKDAIAWLEKQGEQKTADKAESNLLTVERAKEMSPFMRSGFENEYAAWSEEDERYLSYAIHAVEDMLGNNGRNTVTWLKSLKDRYTWKPSDEQMDALEHSLGDYNIKIFEDRCEILKSLYNDLKKLKGE